MKFKDLVTGQLYVIDHRDELAKISNSFADDCSIYKKNIPEYEAVAVSDKKFRISLDVLETIADGEMQEENEELYHYFLETHQLQELDYS